MSSDGSAPTSPEHHNVLVTFLQAIQPTYGRTNHKQAVKDFAKYFQSEAPYLSNGDILVMLQGKEDSIGLLQACGSTDVKRLLTFEVKKSAVLALQLVMKLLDPSFNKDAQRYLNVLTKINTKYLKSMLLDRHILADSSQEANEAPFQFIAILEERIPNFELSLFLETEDAKVKYKSWRVLQTEIGFETSVEVLPDPVTWQEVQLEVLPDLFDDFDGQGQDTAQSHDAFMKMARGMQVHDSEEGNLDPLGFVTLKQSDIKKVQVDWADNLLGDGTVDKISHHSRNFDPITFLADVHKNTPFLQLRIGLTKLKNAVTNRTQQMEKLVQDHFDQFVQCKDTIDTIDQLLAAELPAADGTYGQTNKSVKIQEGLEILRTKANDIYRPLLVRKTEADRIRGVLAVLKKFQFLFTLPGTIRKAIENKQYDGVVRAYKKAKSVVVRDVAVLHKVHQEVYAVVAEFRIFLLKKLEMHQIRLEDQLKIIGYLIDLDCEENPAFYYLTRQFEWICQLMDDCFKHFEKNAVVTSSFASDRRGSVFLSQKITGTDFKSVDVDAWDAKEDVDSITKRRDILHPAPLPVGFAIPKTTDDPALDDAEPITPIKVGSPAVAADTAVRDHQSNKFMKQVTQILLIHLPDFWKLVNDFFSGRFARSGIALSGGDLRRNSFVVNNSKAGGEEEKTDDGVSGLMFALANKYTSLVQPIVLPDGGGLHMVALPPSSLDNLCTLLKLFDSLSKAGIPLKFLEPISLLSDTSVDFYLKQTLISTLHIVSNLHREETWILKSDKEAASTTQLPLRFKAIVMRLLKDVASIPIAKANWIASFIGPFIEIIRALADTFHTLAFDVANSETTSMNTRNAEHRKILAVLSNCIYSRSILLPEIWSGFVELVPESYYHAMKYEREDLDTLFFTLEKIILEQYLRRKILSLNKYVKKGMLLGGIYWVEARTTNEVRTYVLDLLLELVFIHEEIHANIVAELEKIMQSILQKLALSFWECCKQIDSFNHNGAIQTLLEIDLVKNALSRYLSDRSSHVFTLIEEMLTPYLDSVQDDPYCHTQRKVLLMQAQQTAAMMFECFS